MSLQLQTNRIDLFCTFFAKPTDFFVVEIGEFDAYDLGTVIIIIAIEFNYFVNYKLFENAKKKIPKKNSPDGSIFHLIEVNKCDVVFKALEIGLTLAIDEMKINSLSFIEW